jgi:adenine-specific DNA-methyltransferase
MLIVSRFILHAAKTDSVVVDCFGGTGSTAHAVITLNRSDRGRRRFVLVAAASYFDSILKPRVLKAAYSVGWKGGKPVDRQGVSHCTKVIHLESYEDTLNNLQLKPKTFAQQSLLDAYPGMREDYILR